MRKRERTRGVCLAIQEVAHLPFTDTEERKIKGGV